MATLVDNSVRRTLFNMAFPMLAGTFALNAYNLTDTWFVSKLGTVPLAAMGFTLPIVMILRCLVHGAGTGITTLVSHAIGRKDYDTAARLTTHGMAFSIYLTLFITVIGYLTIKPTFALLGADEETLPLIYDYMEIWYFGSVFMTIPMIGNGVLISLGDSRTAAKFMMLGTLLNLVLDPIFIFGYFGVPGMGIRGAAIATILAQAISVLWLWKLLTVKHELISLEKWNGAPFVQSVKNILRLGVPGVLSMILMPVSSAIITKIIGTYGHEAVAACGAAARIEMFAFVIPMALGISMMPFVSQNYGALRMDRIREGITLSTRFAMFYGCFIAVAFYVSAPLMSSFFTEDPVVSDILQSYIRIISFGYGMMEIHRYCGIIMTGLHLPMSSTLLNGFRVFVLLIPLSLLGSHFGGLKGVFFARLMTDLLGGFIGLIWVYRCYRAVAAKTPMPRGSFA